MKEATRRSIRWAQAGLLTNACLVFVKIFAGIIGHSNALIADGIESSADIFSSLIVWMGLSIAARPADEDHPYGHGKAEPLAAAVVSLMLLGAAVGISIIAIRDIRTPHLLPAPFTLFVAAGVIIVKEILYRRVSRVAREVGGTAIVADAWHHRADAISSLAAFIGISVALIGGRGWEAADDWAALVAAGVVAVNGIRTLKPAIAGLMDEAPDRSVKERVLHAATEVDAAAAEAGHSHSAAAAAAEAAAAEATGIGRVGRADEGRGTKRGNGRQSERCISDLAEHVSLLDRFDWGISRSGIGRPLPWSRFTGW